MNIGPWDFTGFDVVVLLVIIISLLMALSRGLFREFISIAALVIGGIAALITFGQFRFAAQDFIQPAWLADGALGLGAFFLTYLLVVFLLRGVAKTLRGKTPGLFDRLLGASFGAFRGLIIMSLFVMIPTASYREGQSAQDFKKHVLENQQNLPDDILDKAPKDIQDWLNKPPPELPFWLEGSLFYPTLDKIGSFIRNLPFAKLKTQADKLREGDLSDILEAINSRSDGS